MQTSNCNIFSYGDFIMNYKQRIIFKTYIIKKNRIYIYDGKNITFDLDHFELECVKWIFIFTKKEMPPNQITVEDHFFIYYI